MTPLRILGLWLVSAVLAGCALVPVAPEPAPLLRLAPASLARSLALQQQLEVSAQGQTHRIDALLEVDATSVRLAVLNAGQTAARLEWDGMQLTVIRAPWLPAAIQGERILSDLQLMLWPADAIRAALPARWTLTDGPSARALRHDGAAVIEVAYPTPTRSVLTHLRDGYRLSVESRSLGGAS